MDTSSINAIETGILRECSVGCQMEYVLCSICGADQVKTKRYGGTDESLPAPEPKEETPPTVLQLLGNIFNV